MFWKDSFLPHRWINCKCSRFEKDWPKLDFLKNFQLCEFFIFISKHERRVKNVNCFSLKYSWSTYLLFSDVSFKRIKQLNISPGTCRYVRYIVFSQTKPTINIFPPVGGPSLSKYFGLKSWCLRQGAQMPKR